MDFTWIVIVIVLFYLIKATRPKICKKSVCLYCITTSLWWTPVNQIKNKFSRFLPSFEILTWNCLCICLDITKIKFDFCWVWPSITPVFRAQEPKAPVTYCDHALSVVRPSSVRLFTFSTSSPEPLDGFWWNLVWMNQGPLLVLLSPAFAKAWGH